MTTLSSESVSSSCVSLNFALREPFREWCIQEGGTWQNPHPLHPLPPRCLHFLSYWKLPEGKHLTSPLAMVCLAVVTTAVNRSRI
jgi:hypothetical protein